MPQSTTSAAVSSSFSACSGTTTPSAFLNLAILSSPSATIVNTASLIAAASRSLTASLTLASRACRAGLNVRADLIIWSATSPEISSTRWKNKRETCGLYVLWLVD